MTPVRRIADPEAASRRARRIHDARSRRGHLLGALALLAAVVAGCGTPVLANPPLEFPAPATASPAPSLAPDPVPVVLPRDDGPHHRLTEWWYYTGHLTTADGRRFGFEAVIFRAERGSVPVTWASHLALTDETGRRFLYAQRSQVGTEVDRSPRAPDGTPQGFALGLTGFDPRDPSTASNPPWVLAGAGGRDTISASLAPAEAAATGGAFSIALELAATKAPALHDRDGYIDFGPAGGSYYYSRTSMRATGSLTLDGRQLAVTGTAWFDHQWGDFISVGGGGWDWFAVNLADGRDVTLSLVRAADGTYPLVYGTLVSAARPDGSVEVMHLDRSAFTVDVLGHWTSPRTGATYPAGWRISIPGERLTIDLRPTVADQELDTRATTGVAYWEGSQTVSASANGRPMGGEAYVELTGYADAR